MYDYTGSGVETTHPGLLHRFGYPTSYDEAGQAHPTFHGLPSIPRLGHPRFTLAQGVGAGEGENPPGETLPMPHLPIRRAPGTGNGTTSPGAGASGGGGTQGGLPGGNQVPTFPNGTFSGFSPQQWQLIQQAVQDGVACVDQNGHTHKHGGGGCSNQQIYNTIVGSLQATGQFTADELAIIEHAIPGMNNPGGNQQGDSPTPFYTAWFNSISQAVSAWLQSAPPPGSQTPGGAASGQDPTLGAILGMLGGGSSGGGAASPGPDSTAGQYQAIPAPAGPPIMPLLLLGGAGVLVYIWNKNRHKGGAAE